MSDITMGWGCGFVWMRGENEVAREFLGKYRLVSTDGMITFDGGHSYTKAHNARMEAERKGLSVDCVLFDGQRISSKQLSEEF